MSNLTDQSPSMSTDPSARTDGYAVDVRGISKVFPRQTSFFSKLKRRPADGHEIRAVDRVSLHIKEGEVFGLVGPNGAGKTTLIKVLTTLLTPTEGEAYIAGRDVVKYEVAVRRSVGLVTSNERSFYWRLTGRQNLAFFADLYHLPQKESRRWIDELLDMVGLSTKGDERFDGYSTGMRQRMALARGLLSKPRILFMDEPTKGIDPIGAAEVIELIRGPIIERWKPSVLITSHNLTEIERLCGRLALMHHGRLIASGALADLRELVRADDVFKLTVRNLSEPRLSELATTAGVDAPVEFTGNDGVIDMQVSFPQGVAGFPKLIRGVVEAGGDVITCTSIEETIDDVFQKLVARATTESAPEGEGAQ